MTAIPAPRLVRLPVSGEKLVDTASPSSRDT
jgi:hypothetical protein